MPLPAGIVRVTERWDGRGLSLDANGVYTGSRAWIVESDAASVDEATVESALPVPLYDPHPARPQAIAQTVTIKPLGKETLWLAEVGYSSAPLPGRMGGPPSAITAGSGTGPGSPSPSGPQAGQNQDTPAPSRLPEWSWGKRDRTKVATLDRIGQPLVNTAGDPLEGVEINDPLLMVVVKWWSLNVTLAHIRSFFNRVNQAAWNGFAARTLLVDDFQVRMTYDQQAAGVYGLVQECTTTFLYDADTWNLQILNAGKREKIGTELKEIVDKSGQPVSEPYPLLSSGAKWTPASALVYLNAELKQVADFSTLFV